MLGRQECEGCAGIKCVISFGGCLVQIKSHLLSSGGPLSIIMAINP